MTNWVVNAQEPFKAHRRFQSEEAALDWIDKELVSVAVVWKFTRSQCECPMPEHGTCLPAIADCSYEIYDWEALK
jgi:hypothetical protein